MAFATESILLFYVYIADNIIFGRL